MNNSIILLLIFFQILNFCIYYDLDTKKIQNSPIFKKIGYIFMLFLPSFILLSLINNPIIPTINF